MGMFFEGLTVRGESASVYRLVGPLGKRPGPATINLWKVVRDSDPRSEFVAKGPKGEDDGSRGWPAFHHEAEMQCLFGNDPMVRHMVDFIPEAEVGTPIMILEPFQKTLWDARLTRPFTRQEIKWIMKGCLLGIMTVHREGYVHTGSHPLVCIC